MNQSDMERSIAVEAAQMARYVLEQYRRRGELMRPEHRESLRALAEGRLTDFQRSRASLSSYATPPNLRGRPIRATNPARNVRSGLPGRLVA
jgi:hypothetical protein